jgi:hypothetical protein
MEKDFSYLLNPALLPNAYQQALLETSRRNEFKVWLDTRLRQVAAGLEVEKEKRTKFLSQFGRILPNDFIPQLKMMPPSISLSKVDQDLPDIQGLHPESDSLKSSESNCKTSISVGSNEQLLQRELEEVQGLLARTQAFMNETMEVEPMKRQFKDLLAATAKNSARLFMQRNEATLKARDMNVSELANLQAQLRAQNETCRSHNQQLQDLRSSSSKDQKAIGDLTAQATTLKNRVKYLETDLANK